MPADGRPGGAKTYRVVQWATGNVGSRALRHVIEHPDLELAGVYVHSAAKAGRDAGELAGVAPTGVKASNSKDEVLALKPDCVLYMPHVFDVGELCAILASGANVVSTRMELQNPATLDPADRAKIEAACREGGASVHATGSSPGFITEAMPVVLASIQRRLDCISIFEFADCSSRLSPEMLFEMMGFASPPNPALAEGLAHHMKTSFSGTLKLTAETLGLTVDRIEVKGEMGVARSDIQLAAGPVPKGTVAATRTAIVALHGDKPVMRMVATWYVSSDVDTPDGEPWNFRESGWRVLVEGDSPMDINITFPCRPEDYAEMTPNLTANRPVNSIPYVCGAPPGFRSTFDLPQVIARLG